MPHNITNTIQHANAKRTFDIFESYKTGTILTHLLLIKVCCIYISMCNDTYWRALLVADLKLKVDVGNRCFGRTRIWEIFGGISYNAIGCLCRSIPAFAIAHVWCLKHLTEWEVLFWFSQRIDFLCVFSNIVIAYFVLKYYVRTALHFQSSFQGTTVNISFMIKLLFVPVNGHAMRWNVDNFKSNEVNCMYLIFYLSFLQLHAFVHRPML